MPRAARFISFLKYAFIAAFCFVLAPMARANVCTTSASGNWSSSSIWGNGIIPSSGDSVLISAGDSVVLDLSTPVLLRITVNGYLNLGTDTLNVRATLDTAIIVTGTLDAANGWFVNVADTTWMVLIDTGSLFRTAATFPPDLNSIYDTVHTPQFVLDPASTFEYYSANNGVTDVSYLLKNIPNHRYENLTLTNCVGTYFANLLTVHNTLHLNFGASMKAGYTPQTVTINGNVLNDNQGPSGSPGAGSVGCGFLSLGDETWVFDAASTGSGKKDTVHWSGPSQLGSVLVRENTVLSIRYLDNKHCDSLDILTNLTEENPPCGGHLIGRAYTELSQTLTAANPVDNFAGLGLRIASGTNPYLGLTKVTRTSGYFPPGANPANGPMLRYYRITTSAGPQSTPDTISMSIHCDEMNGADLSRLNFWRSFDNGGTWALSGIESYDRAQNIFTWDTTVLGWPNDSGSFLWMLSDGYTDIPLPVTLEHFSAVRMGTAVELAWQTGSESEVAGFEIDRIVGNDSEMIGNSTFDDSLRSKSPTGALYHFSDPAAPDGSVHYDLFEITNDGIPVWLASATPTSAEQDSLAISDIRYAKGELSFIIDNNYSEPLDLTITAIDAAGRIALTKVIECHDGAMPVVPLALSPGIYFIRISAPGISAIQKIAAP